jgi:hypothetical protein
VTAIAIGFLLARACDAAAPADAMDTNGSAAPTAWSPDELYARVAPSVVTIVAKD